MHSVIAVDLGGTKLTTAVVDAAGVVLYRKKAVVARGAPEEAIAQIATAITDASKAAPADKPVRAAGMIVPGIYFAETGNVWLPNLWGHEQVPLRDELQRMIGVPVVVDSDRAGYVLGERWLGVARGMDDVVFLAVGTGIGAGIVSGGRLVRGHGDIAGAVGWFTLNTEQQEIYAHVGCWEAEAAGPGLARRVNAHSAEAVIVSARAGEPKAQRAIEITAQYLGMGIANLVSLLNPQMIVLGGGLMQAGDLFLETIKRVVAERAQPIAAKQVRIELTALGEDAGMFGAARLALDAEM